MQSYVMTRHIDVEGVLKVVHEETRSMNTGHLEQKTGRSIKKTGKVVQKISLEINHRRLIRLNQDQNLETVKRKRRVDIINHDGHVLYLDPNVPPKSKKENLVNPVQNHQKKLLLFKKKLL